MKIRIGVGAAGASSSTEALAELVTGLDELGFDSLWLSEVLTGPVLDPVVGLAWAAASNPRLKVGTTMLLPGRNVLRLAKQLASLDVLCKGRLLVTLVPGLTYAPEREAIGVDPKQRGAFIDEALPAAAAPVGGRDGEPRRRRRPLQGRQALAAARCSSRSRCGSAATVPAALERCGRLSDGWLPSLCTPDGGGGGPRRDRGGGGAGRALDQRRALRHERRLRQRAHRPGHRAHDGRAASPRRSS